MVRINKILSKDGQIIAEAQKIENEKTKSEEKSKD